MLVRSVAPLGKILGVVSESTVGEWNVYFVLREI